MAEDICRIDGCERPVKIKKHRLCGRHYARWAKYRDPLFVQPRGRPLKGEVPTNRYPSRDLICQECGATFRGRHGRTCRRCYYKREGSLCMCGNPISPNAKGCMACKIAASRGEKNCNWNGGRFVGRNGYVMRYEPDHPRIKGVYVPEHQLVMEDVLGRYLLPGENVHHRNGVRDDNRPENLELWVKAQPAGQRAVELLAWAREIIERYEPIEGQLRLFD